MRTIRDYTLTRESPDARDRAGRYHAARMLHIRGVLAEPVTLEAGDNDAIDVFSENGRVYVLSTHTGLPYVGLQVFDASGAEVGNVFIQEHDEACKLCDLAPINRCKRLADIAAELEG